MNALLGVRTGRVCVGPALVAVASPLPRGAGIRDTHTQAQDLLGRARDSHCSTLRFESHKKSLGNWILSLVISSSLYLPISP